MLNLLITASINQYTYRSGATEISIPEETLFSYIQQLVIPELQEQDINNLPVLKSTCLKFVYMFRNQVPEEHTQNFIHMFCGFLLSGSPVNQSYAAACIEKLLIKRSKQGDAPLLTNENMDQNLLMGLLTNLCNLLNAKCDLYAIRTLFRVVQLSKQKVETYAAELSNVLTKFIHDIAQEKETISPNYVYILFETTALTLKYITGNPEQMSNMQNNLSQSLNFIIENNKVELMGYAFQIYALFVASASQNNDIFRALTNSILQNQDNWSKEMKFLIPSLGQFLISMICKF